MDQCSQVVLFEEVLEDIGREHQRLGDRDVDLGQLEVLLCDQLVHEGEAAAFASHRS